MHHNIDIMQYVRQEQNSHYHYHWPKKNLGTIVMLLIGTVAEFMLYWAIQGICWPFIQPKITFSRNLCSGRVNTVRQDWSWTSTVVSRCNCINNVDNTAYKLPPCSKKIKWHWEGRLTPVPPFYLTWKFCKIVWLQARKLLLPSKQTSYQSPIEVLLVMASTVSMGTALLCLCMARGRRPGSVKRAMR